MQRKPVEITRLVQKKKPEEEEALQAEEIEGSTPEVTPPLESRITSLKGSGSALPESARSFFEPRFGSDFSEVRVHSGGAAHELARSVNAHAFTVGRDIVFGSRRFAPESEPGKRLLAHELTHVVQQTGSSRSNPDRSWKIDRAPAIDNPVKLARPGGNVQRDQADPRTEDPNFLMCLALCEIGIPPDLWRTVVNEMLSAASEEYRQRNGDMRGSQEFQRWRAEFAVWSDFNKLKAVVVFLGESKVGPLTIEHAGAMALRRALLTRLAGAGVREAAIVTASQIIRKVAAFIEVAVAAGCATYCGGTAVARALISFSTGAMEAVANFASALGQAGSALSQAIGRQILIARITMDPSNWNVSALPTRSRAHLQAIGLAFRLAFTPDDFFTHMARRLDSYNIANILNELSADINATLQGRGGFVQMISFTPQFTGSLTPIQLVNILKDYHLLAFTESPETLADRQLNNGGNP